jgi:hypothetical protein
MKIPSPQKNALDMFVSEAVQTFPEELLRIILFGSLARGEANADSDVDILVNIKDENFRLRRKLIGMAFDIHMETKVDLSVISEDEFESLKKIILPNHET